MLTTVNSAQNETMRYLTWMFGGPVTLGYLVEIVKEPQRFTLLL
jgi:hypothetical protein